MKVKKFTLFALLSFVIGTSAFTFFEKAESRYFPREAMSSSSELAESYEKYLQMVRSDKETGGVNPADVLRARSHVERMKLSKSNLNVNWAFKGPDNIGGRARAIIIDRNNSNHLIAGGVSGGLFESFDGATSWQPYDSDFSITSISCITQDAAGDFYIGTGGHFDAGGASFQADDKNRSSDFIGSGIYKLTGNGNFETVVSVDNSTSVSYGVPYATVGTIAADPNVPGKLYVASNHGFRVLEKEGTTWKDTTYINYNKKCLDVNIASNGNLLVTFKDSDGNPADRARVYTSTDGMATWNMTEFNGAGRIEGDIAPSSPNVMYLSAARTNRCLLNIYRSSDAGLTWQIIGPGGTTSFDMFGTGIGSCQGYYDNMISVAPTDPGKIFVGGVTLYSWTQSTTDPAPPNGSWRRVDVNQGRYAIGFLDPRYVHSDKHNMVFDRTNPDVAYIVSDGGVTRSDNILDPQPFFSESNFNFSVTQFYNIAVNSNDIVLGGTQDNGSNLIGLEYNTNRAGLQVLGGDGFGSELSTINPQIGVASLYFNRFFRVQGIGTTIGNTNISRADIISNNTFYGGLCGPIGCGGPFYTALELWESFDHAESRDSVEILYERVNLPPIPADTIIAFEGNNNKYPQVDTLTQPTFPFDTAIGGIDSVLYTVQRGAINRVIANFDTIYFDTSNAQIAVVRRGQLDTLINYVVGRTYSFSNVVSAPFRTTIDVLTAYRFRVRSPQVTFRYKIHLHDKVQSILASANWAGLTNTVDYDQRNIIITRDLLKNTPDVKWFNIAGANSTPDPIGNFNTILSMEFSRDGNYLFVGTSNGDVYRISDIDSIHENSVQPSVGANLYSIQRGQMAGKCKKIGRFTGRSVTGISVDPNNANNVIVALGNYGNSGYVARTTFALTATDPSNSFELIQGTGATQLPQVPAYSALIDKNDSNRVFLGTDMGIFVSDNAFTANSSDVNWYEENVGIGRVPVYDIRQMVFDYNNAKNDGKIYAGTHARGIFETDQFTSVQEISREVEEVNAHFESGLKIYPNPVRDFAKIEFKLAERADVRIQVYSLNGRLVKEEQYSNQSEGKNTLQVNFGDLSNGTYIIRAISGDKVGTSKLLLYK